MLFLFSPPSLIVVVVVVVCVCARALAFGKLKYVIDKNDSNSVGIRLSSSLYNITIMSFRYAFFLDGDRAGRITTESDSDDGGSCISSVQCRPFSTHLFITIRRRVGRVRLVKIQYSVPSPDYRRVTAVKK